MRSPFSSRNITTIPIPGLDGQTAEIRQLAGKQLQAAKDAQLRDSVAKLGSFDAALVQTMKALSPTEIKAEATSDPLSGFDQATLIAKGVLSWSLEVPPSLESADDLDDEIREGLAREVLRWSKPSLFRSAEEFEADRKNG